MSIKTSEGMWRIWSLPKTLTRPERWMAATALLSQAPQTASVGAHLTLNTRLAYWKEQLSACHSVIILKLMWEFVYFQTGIVMKWPHKAWKMASQKSLREHNCPLKVIFFFLCTERNTACVCSKPMDLVSQYSTDLTPRQNVGMFWYKVSLTKIGI